MSQVADLDEVSVEFQKYGISTLIFVFGFIALFFIFAGPGLMNFPLQKFLAESATAPKAPLYAAYGGILAAIIAIVAVVCGPIFMLLLAKFLKKRIHYRFCKFAVTYLSVYRPNRSILIEKTLILLENDSVRKSFQN